MNSTTQEPELSLQETLRVMDVARALRKERESVERAFSRDEERAILRKRLTETAQVTGDKITEAEIDAAIAHYYGTLHAFHPPPPGWATFCAHVWVLRRTIMVLGSLLFGSVLIMWWLFWSASGPFSSTGRLNRNLAEAVESIERHVSSIQAIAEDRTAIEEAQELKRKAAIAKESQDLKSLESINRQIETLDRQLGESFEVRIVGNDGRQSAFEGVMTDETGSRAAGHFVIVEARDESAIRLPACSGVARVARWGELAWPSQSASVTLDRCLSPGT